MIFFLISSKVPITALDPQPLGGKNGHFAGPVPTQSQSVAWCYQLTDPLFTCTWSRKLELFRSDFSSRMCEDGCQQILSETPLLL